MFQIRVTPEVDLVSPELPQRLVLHRSALPDPQHPDKAEVGRKSLDYEMLCK